MNWTTWSARARNLARMTAPDRKVGNLRWARGSGPGPVMASGLVRDGMSQAALCVMVMGWPSSCCRQRAMEVLPELEPPFKTTTGTTHLTVPGRASDTHTDGQPGPASRVFVTCETRWH